MQKRIVLHRVSGDATATCFGIGASERRVPESSGFAHGSVRASSSQKLCQLVSASGGLLRSQVRFSPESTLRAVARMGADTNGVARRERELERRRVERERLASRERLERRQPRVLPRKSQGSPMRVRAWEFSFAAPSSSRLSACTLPARLPRAVRTSGRRIAGAPTRPAAGTSARRRPRARGRASVSFPQRPGTRLSRAARARSGIARLSYRPAYTWTS